MKYSIKRDGWTVIIGHAKDLGLRNDEKIGRSLDEISRRLTPRKFPDGGVTFLAADTVKALLTGDIVVMQEGNEIVTVRVTGEKSYDIIDRGGAPVTSAEFEY